MSILTTEPEIGPAFSKTVCPNCNDNTNSIITDAESGEIICSNCGLVISSDKTQQTRSDGSFLILTQVTTLQEAECPSHLQGMIWDYQLSSGEQTEMPLEI